MVKYIEYKEKRYPVRVSYLALKMVSEKTGKQLSQMDVDKFDPQVQEQLLFWALKSGANATGETLTLNETDMEAVLDECFIQFTQMIPEFFVPKKDAEDANEAVRVAMKSISQKMEFLTDEQKVILSTHIREVFDKGHEKGFIEGAENEKKQTAQSGTQS